MKTSRSVAVTLRSLVCSAALTASAASGVIACASDDDDGDAGTGASSGAGATSGNAGSGAGRGGSGGTSGKGGSAGTGANAGNGAGGTGDSEAGQGGGGADGSPGGSGSGGVGSAGDAGAAGDASSAGNPGTGGSGEGASGGAAGDAGAGGSSGGATIDTCFEDLRPLKGSSQISTRENADEQVRLRIALETADRLGTSGTYPWAAVRLALEIEGTLICLDEAALESAYAGTHHNCSDVLSFDFDGQSYEITSPDSRGLEDASLTVSSGGSTVLGPVTLTATECAAAGGAECHSGGPC